MLNILVVDDSDTARKRVANTIEKTSIEHSIVAQAEDGVVALSQFKEFSINLIITDLEMPKMNGMDLIKEIRKIDESVHIIVISSLINEQVKQTLKHDRFLDFVKKPMEEKTVKILLQKVEHHILKGV